PCPKQSSAPTRRLQEPPGQLPPGLQWDCHIVYKTLDDVGRWRDGRSPPPNLREMLPSEKSAAQLRRLRCNTGRNGSIAFRLRHRSNNLASYRKCKLPDDCSQRQQIKIVLRGMSISALPIRHKSGDTSK